MTEQERPRTEAGRRLWDYANAFTRLDKPETRNKARDIIREEVFRIEAEGRQQAVREIRPAITDVRLAAEANGHGWIVTTDAWARLVLAAGLNASESPPTRVPFSPLTFNEQPLTTAMSNKRWWGVEHVCGEERREYPTLHWVDEPEHGAGPRQAFECDECGDRYLFHEVGDASESGQPPDLMPHTRLRRNQPPEAKR